MRTASRWHWWTGVGETCGTYSRFGVVSKGHQEHGHIVDWKVRKMVIWFRASVEALSIACRLIIHLNFWLRKAERRSCKEFRITTWFLVHCWSLAQILFVNALWWTCLRISSVRKSAKYRTAIQQLAYLRADLGRLSITDQPAFLGNPVRHLISDCWPA